MIAEIPVSLETFTTTFPFTLNGTGVGNGGETNLLGIGQSEHRAVGSRVGLGGGKGVVGVAVLAVPERRELPGRVSLGAGECSRRRNGSRGC